MVDQYADQETIYWTSLKTPNKAQQMALYDLSSEYDRPLEKDSAQYNVNDVTPDEPKVGKDGYDAPKKKSASGFNFGKAGGFGYNPNRQESLDSEYDAKYPLAGSTVDGRTVGNNVSNTGSISSSLDEYEVLKGVREVSFSSFDQMGKLHFYSVSEERLTQDLAAIIKKSGYIDPLIVVHDKEGPYILEGSHRFDALRMLEAKSFPALVVLDSRALAEDLDRSRARHLYRTDRIFWVSTAELDKRWKASLHSDSSYLVPGGVSKVHIGDRYKDAIDYQAGTGPVNASEVSIWPDGTAVFSNGRHTFAVMRDRGDKMVPSILNARKTGFIPPAKKRVGKGQTPVMQHEEYQETIEADDDILAAVLESWTGYKFNDSLLDILAADSLLLEDEEPSVLTKKKKKPKVKTPQELAADAEDIRLAQIDRDNITPAQRRELARVQKIARMWVAANPNMPEISAHQYLQDKKAFPPGKMPKEALANHFDQVNRKLDYNNPRDRAIAAEALTHDAMHALASKSTAYGWYDRTVDKAINKIAEIAPDILTNREDELAFKLATAICSQGQDVFPNFDSGYLAYRYWKIHRKFPIESAVFGGGIKFKPMIKNFEKVNKLWKEEGTEEFIRILETKMTMRDMEKNYGVKKGNESPNHEMEGAAMLGPKIGSFYNNLNKRFHTITFDLWASRTMNRMSGKMLKFSFNALLKDRTRNGVPKPSHVSQLENLLATGALKGPEARAMKKEAHALRKLGPKPSREQVLQTAPVTAAWAKQLHREYAVGANYEKGFPEEMKNPSTLLAKNLDTNLTQLSDLPKGPVERKNWREVFELVQANLRAAGIEMNHANSQALFWFVEQQLFKKSGARNRASFDYLDASHRLVRKVRTGLLPPMSSPEAGAAASSASSSSSVGTTGMGGPL